MIKNYSNRQSNLKRFLCHHSDNINVKAIYTDTAMSGDEYFKPMMAKYIRWLWYRMPPSLTPGEK